MRHYLSAGFLVLVVAIATYLGLEAIHLLPMEASAQAETIDQLWNYQVMAISFLFALIVVPLLYSLVVFRRKKGDNTDAEHIEGNTALEIGWTIAPLFAVIAFAYMGAWSLRETRLVDPQAMVIKVHAQQFSWTFEYPDYGGFISEDLHLPLNKQILLQMDSKDVIHSFWVPEFRVKQDVVPGHITELRITPNLAGNYTLRCAELCGASHYNMRRPVVVSEESEFTAWAEEQQAAFAANQTPEGLGERLVKANGCLGCHTVDGSKSVGPTWKGLFGSKVTLSDGSTVLADETYLSDSILNPTSQIVEGFQALMPASYAGVFSQEDISNIIAYLMTLK